MRGAEGLRAGGSRGFHAGSRESLSLDRTRVGRGRGPVTNLSWQQSGEGTRDQTMKAGGQAEDKEEEEQKEVDAVKNGGRNGK